VDFTFSEIQDELRKQAREWAQERWPLERAQEAEYDASTWPELAELGWLGVSIPEEQGGAGLSFLEEAVLFDELGYALYAGPFFSTVGLAATALEAVGVGQRALELAVEYVGTREQFGKKIGIYQAVSHQVVDAFVDVELARSLAYWAAWAVAEGDPHAPLAAAAAKAKATEAAVAACERSIQVHGGIGFTWEHPLHRFYKRAQWLESFAGYPAVHRATVAKAVLAGEAEAEAKAPSAAPAHAK
jgi:alkylation response protein AidB-like acyl-CoA dehydrogenase